MGIVDNMEINLWTQWKCGHYGDEVADTMGIVVIIEIHLRTQWELRTIWK